MPEAGNQTLTPELLLEAYSRGYFPMAESSDNNEIWWHSPDVRGIIPLDSFRCPGSLQKFIKKGLFRVTVNYDFSGVISACAQSRSITRKDTWINDEIMDAYIKLHELGYAYSFETWQDSHMVGGLYGVAIDRAFFGESMFSLVSNASKVALVYLVEWLMKNNYTLLDTQFANDHLKQFGVTEISRLDYLKLLDEAIT